MSVLKTQRLLLGLCGTIALALTPVVCVAQNHQTPLGHKYDEFPGINCEDEMAHLDNYAIELQNDPKLYAYVVVYAGRVSRINEAIARAKRIRLYLVNNRRIKAGRVVLIDGGYRGELEVELWVLPREAKPPIPTPTLTRREVRVRNIRARVVDCARRSDGR